MKEMHENDVDWRSVRQYKLKVWEERLVLNTITLILQQELEIRHNV